MNEASGVRLRTLNMLHRPGQQNTQQIHLATLNVRGIRNPEKQLRLLDAFQRSPLQVLCLQETWHDLRTASLFTDLARSLDLQLVISTPKDEAGAGVAILCKADQVQPLSQRLWSDTLIAAKVKI